MTKRLIALLAALAFAFCAASAAFARGANARTNSFPEGFNEHDRQKLLEFFLIEDANGVSNGEKLFSGQFDPDDPNSWGCAVWAAADGEYRLRRFDVSLSALGNARLEGTLDLSGCTSLYYLNAENTGVSGLRLSGCSALSVVFCGFNAIESVDVTGCWALEHFSCQSNPIRMLDLSETSTGVRRLDAGPGYISMVNSDADNKITAHVPAGYIFKGWMNGEGTVVTMSETFTSSVYIDTAIVMTALMEREAATGDVNCDGVITATDISALFAYVMNAGSISDGAALGADVNGDGAVDATDASLLAQMVFGG